jgi:hypothetical protein
MLPLGRKGGYKKSGYLIICLDWLLVDMAFELGQRYSFWSLSIIPNCFSDIPFLENTWNFFLQGTSDPVDLAAIIIGTVIAYFMLLATNKKGVI